MEEQSYNPEQEEKHKRWQEIANEVEQTGDKLGHPIDENIRETVIAFRALGMETTASCEGHLNWGTGGPYLDFRKAGIENLSEERKNVVEGYSKDKNKYSEELKKLNESVDIENAEVFEQTLQYLEEFYKEREIPADRRLLLHSYATDIRLESQGVPTFIALKEKDKEAKLKEYQEEMGDFTKFLRNKFFS